MKLRIPPIPTAFFWSPFHSWLLLALTALACLMSGCVSSKTALRRQDSAVEAAVAARTIQCEGAIDMLNGMWIERWCKSVIVAEMKLAYVQQKSAFRIPKICSPYMRLPKSQDIKRAR